MIKRLLSLNLIICMLLCCTFVRADEATKIARYISSVHGGNDYELKDAKAKLIALGDKVVPVVVDALFAGYDRMSIREMNKRNHYLDVLLKIKSATLLPHLRKAYFSTKTHVWLREPLRKLILTQSHELVRKTLLEWHLAEAMQSEFTLNDAVMMLAQVGNEQTDVEILSWLQRDDLMKRRDLLRLALLLITKRGLKNADDKLVALLSNAEVIQDLTVLHELVLCLGELKVGQAIPVIKELLAQEQRVLYRSQYYKALGWIANREAVAILLTYLEQLLNSKDYNEAIPVIIALGETKQTDAAEYLIVCIKKTQLRSYTITALGNLGDLNAMPALIEYIGNPELTALVIQSLRQLTAKHFGYTKGRNMSKDLDAIQKWKTYVVEFVKNRK